MGQLVHEPQLLKPMGTKSSCSAAREAAAGEAQVHQIEKARAQQERPSTVKNEQNEPAFKKWFSVTLLRG